MRLFIFSLAFLMASTAAAEIVVLDAWARASAPGARAGAAYVTLQNNGGQADRLINAVTDVAGMIELHNTVTNAQGHMQMLHLEEGLALPAGVEVGMAPGGYHVMLMMLHEPLEEGLEFPLRLEFENAPAQNIRVEIKPLTYRPQLAE